MVSSQNTAGDSGTLSDGYGSFVFAHSGKHITVWYHNPGITPTTPVDKVPRKKQDAVKRGLRKIYTAENLTAAQTYAHRWTRSWKEKYPKAVTCLQDDVEDLLTCFQFADPEFRKAIRTTNAIERRFREVRRRTRPMGVFSNRTSVERILYAVFMYENINLGVYPVFVLTQNT